MSRRSPLTILSDDEEEKYRQQPQLHLQQHQPDFNEKDSTYEIDADEQLALQLQADEMEQEDREEVQLMQQEMSSEAENQSSNSSSSAAAASASSHSVAASSSTAALHASAHRRRVTAQPPQSIPPRIHVSSSSFAAEAAAAYNAAHSPLPRIPSRTPSTDPNYVSSGACLGLDPSSGDELAFFLNRVYGQGKRCALRLSHILSGDVQRCIMFNYCIDLEWMCDALPQLQTYPRVDVVHVSSHTTKTGKDERFPNVTHYTPPLPVQFGVHHSKMFILFYSTGVRIAIVTANFIQIDWLWKNNVSFIQDFPKKNEYSPTKSPFEDDLNDYLRSYAKSKLDVREIALYDFSGAKTILIPSVPGRHRGADLYKYGHMKLRKVLSQEKLHEKFQKAAIVAQFSSVGSIAEKWLLQELRTSMAPPAAPSSAAATSSASASAAASSSSSPSPLPQVRFFLVPPVRSYQANVQVNQKRKIGSSGFPLPTEEEQQSASKRTKLAASDDAKSNAPVNATSMLMQSASNMRLPPLKLIWPTCDQVRASLEGWSAGMSLCCDRKNMKDFMRPYLHKWDGEAQERTCAMPHIKSYTRVAADGEMAWCLITSSNMSNAAHGQLQLNDTQLQIRSYELGCLFLPSHYARALSILKQRNQVNFTCTPDAPIIYSPKGDRMKLPYFADRQNQSAAAASSSASSTSASSSSSSSSTIPYTVLFPLPYNPIDPRPYTSSDEPWTWDLPRTQLDCRGNQFVGVSHDKE